jgi:hypothetical protein
MSTSQTFKRPKKSNNKSLTKANNIPLKNPTVYYTIPDLAIILSLVYMGAGLPPEPALRSALADYIHSFSSYEQESV